MNKKGIGVGQVFIFIIAAISFSLIMIFGYRAISGFISSGEQVQFVQFKTDLEGSIKKIYTEYSSVRIETYHLPGEFTKVCFVNMDYSAESIDAEMSGLCANDSYACNVWKDAKDEQLAGKGGYSSVEENVFLSPRQEGQVPIKVYRISIGDKDNPEDDTISHGYLCEKISGGAFSLVLEGKGDHTRLYPRVGGDE